MPEVWAALPATAQDALWTVLLLLPGLLVGAILLRGFAPGVLVAAMVRRFAGVNAVFVMLIAIAVAVGIGLTAQERALREGSARAASGFDLIVAAPGSEITAMLATVYLQPHDLPLLSGAQYAEVAGAPGVVLAAPIAFGDSHDGAPVVGTTTAFVTHLAGPLAEGAMFTSPEEAVAGALAPVAIGDRFSPAHGQGAAAETDAHDHVYTVTGRMAPTGSPWDRAILVPVEAVWEVHGLAGGHDPAHGHEDGPADDHGPAGQAPDADAHDRLDTERIGPPYEAARFPGTPAVLVRAGSVADLYALQARFSRGDMMAFFPGTVLAQLHGVMRDVRTTMSVLALVTQGLVAVAVLAGLMILGQLHARHLALLRVLGAPLRFVLAVVWAQAAVLIVAGAGLGLGLGWVAAQALSAWVTARTDVVVDARIAWTELHLVAGFISLALLVALLPALAALRRPVTRALRS